MALEAGAVVFVPDYRLVPVGNYSDIVESLTVAWDWLARHPESTEVRESTRVVLGDIQKKGVVCIVYILHGKQTQRKHRAISPP